MNLNPTHVVVNFGLWMTGSTRGCGLARGQRCPYLPDLCALLTADHEFKLIWQTTTPKWSTGDTITDNHLHVPHACHLDPSMVLHRGLVFKALSEAMNQWTPLFHDDMHFAPPAYHAFNGALLEKIMGGADGDGEPGNAEPQDAADELDGILIAKLDS